MTGTADQAKEALPKQFYNGFSKKCLKLQVTSKFIKYNFWLYRLDLFKSSKIISTTLQIFWKWLWQESILEKILNMITIWI